MKNREGGGFCEFINFFFKFNQKKIALTSKGGAKMKKHNKLFLLPVTGVLILVLFFSFNLNQALAESIKIRIGSTNPPLGLDAQTVKLFVKLAENKLGNKVEFEVFGGGTLGSYKEMLEMVKVNTLEVLYQSIGLTELWSPIGGIEGVPYLYSDLETFKKFWTSDLAREYLDAVAKETGYYMIGPHWRGFRIMTVKKPVRTPADLKQIKLRVPSAPTYIAAWKAMGANVAPMNFGEVFSALQQGVIDGQENPLIHSYDSGFGEICKYIVLTNHQAETIGWMFDTGYFNKLPRDVQNGLKNAAYEAGRWHELSVVLNEAAYLDKFRKLNAEIIVPDRKAFQKLAVNTKLDPKLQAWVDKIRKQLGE